MGEVRKVLHGVKIADCPPELREKLQQYDTNGNGIIDPNELPDPMSAEMTYLKVSSFPKKVQPLLNEIDDEKNGKIEMDELTDILTVYSDLKKANKEGSIAIKTLPKEIQATLKAFDVDGDGTVAPMELARGAELYKESKKTTKRLTIFSGVLLVILCALVGVIVGLTAVVVEASKETKTDSKTGITFAKGSSKPSATAKVTKTDSIYNAVKKSASDLRAIGSLTLGKPDGSSLIYSITGAETHGGAPGKANAVAFYSARGDVINVTATSLNVTKEDGTIVMTDTIVAEKSRRRRLLDPACTDNWCDDNLYGEEADSKLTQNTETDGSAGTDCTTENQGGEIDKLRKDLAAKEQEIAEKFQKDLADKEMVFASETEKLKKDHADKEQEITEKFQKDLAVNKEDCASESKKLQEDLAAKEQEITEKFQKDLADKEMVFASETEKLKKDHADKEQEITEKFQKDLAVNKEDCASESKKLQEDLAKKGQDCASEIDKLQKSTSSTMPPQLANLFASQLVINCLEDNAPCIVENCRLRVGFCQ
ncbi:EF-hand domain-containing protein [Pseudoscourfieldia marina]